MRPARRRVIRNVVVVVVVVIVAIGGARWVWSQVSAGRDAAARLTVVLDAEDRRDFAFTTAGKGLDDFTLDDDNDATLPRRVVFSGLAPGAYRVTQAATPGWTLRALTCSSPETVDRARRQVTLDLAGGDDVTCTFTNVPIRPHRGAPRGTAAHDGDVGGAGARFT